MFCVLLWLVWQQHLALAGLMLLLMVAVVYKAQIVHAWYVARYVVLLVTAPRKNVSLEQLGYTSQTLRLADGRLLEYNEYGTPGGHPVFYFHGSPTAEPEVLLAGAENIIHAGVRLIAANRPGIGRSTFQPGRDFSHWPADVVELADSLGINRFSVLGYSGGGPYVAACTAAIPHRLVSAMIVSGAWKMNDTAAKQALQGKFRLFWIAVEKYPVLLRKLLASFQTQDNISKEDALAAMENTLDGADFNAIRQGDNLQLLNKAVDIGLFNSHGAVYDVSLFIKSNNFPFANSGCPIDWLHGSRDRNVPLPVAQAAVQQLPHATLHVFADDAHLSILCHRFGTIAAALQGQPVMVPAAASQQAADHNGATAATGLSS